MSRHDLELKHPSGDITRAVIGWDRPLRTFFAQVFARDAEEGERAIVWEGMALDEITTAAAAITLVAPYAVVPDGLEAQLEAEKRDSYDRADGPEQRAAKRFLRSQAVNAAPHQASKGKGEGRRAHR